MTGSTPAEGDVIEMIPRWSSRTSQWCSHNTASKQDASGLDVFRDNSGEDQ